MAQQIQIIQIKEMRNDENREKRNETSKGIPNLNYYPGFKEMIKEMIRNDKKNDMMICKN